MDEMMNNPQMMAMAQQMMQGVCTMSVTAV
jgi:hypothetical protein